MDPLLQELTDAIYYIKDFDREYLFVTYSLQHSKILSFIHLSSKAEP